jgi:antitoxin VapB
MQSPNLLLGDEVSVVFKAKPFKIENSQAVRIPADMAYSNLDIELEIERHGDEIRIRPHRKKIGDVLGTFEQFSDDFMSERQTLNSAEER